MRMLMKVNIPTCTGNEAVKAGTLGAKIEQILKEQKAEAAYFAEDGMRTGLIIVDMKSPSDIPALAEPWFLAFNAKVELQPVMIPADLKKAGPAIKKAVTKYGKKYLDDIPF